MESVSKNILLKMIKNLGEAYFARDVMDILVKRNPEDVMPWEWETNDRLSYFHFENKFEGGIHTYVELKNVYELVCGEISEESEKEIKKCAQDLANHQMELSNWAKAKEG